MPDPNPFHRMSIMIDGVLTFSTLNAAEQIPETVDLNEVLKNIEADLELAIAQKKAIIHYADLPKLEGAPVLLYQLFYNLINNSIKFARTEQPPIISITAARLLNGDSPFFKIILQDNGIGFEPEYSEKIFNTFTRLHSKDRYDGTGLGLALCKKIAERHGGNIEASGRLGEGATFTINLPKKQKDNLI